MQNYWWRCFQRGELLRKRGALMHMRTIKKIHKHPSDISFTTEPPSLPLNLIEDVCWIINLTWIKKFAESVNKRVKWIMRHYHTLCVTWNHYFSKAKKGSYWDFLFIQTKNCLKTNKIWFKKIVWTFTSAHLETFDPFKAKVGEISLSYFCCFQHLWAMLNEL